MALSEGWIKVHRKIERCEALKCKEFDKVHAFIWMIEEANIKPSTIENVSGRGQSKIKRGQFRTSFSSLANEFGWSERKIRTFIDALEAEKMIKTVRDNNGLTIEITRYKQYQDDQKKRHAKRHASDSADDTAGDIENSTVSDNDRHAKRHAKRHATDRHNKNIEENKKEADSGSRFVNAPGTEKERERLRNGYGPSLIEKKEA